MSSPDQLGRFVAAQDQGGTYATALTELETGHKRSHWMWFVFPQLAGLGRSPMAQHFALEDLAEAQAYATHPVLGARLRACTQALLDLPHTDPVAVLGDIDALKLRSSMTLFARAVPAEPAFTAVLDRYFAGEPDPVTLDLLSC